MTLMISVRGLTKLLEGHYNIIEVDPTTGEPLLPAANAKKLVNHYGVLVRDGSRLASMKGNRGRMILGSLLSQI
jgi:hypothetical protein